MTVGRAATGCAAGVLALLAVACEPADPVVEAEAEEPPEVTLRPWPAAPPTPSPGPPRKEAEVDAPGPLRAPSPFAPLPSPWRAPGELAPSPFPAGHPMAERGGGPRPDPPPVRNEQGRPLYRVDSLPLPGGPREIRSDLYESGPRFPVAFHTYLPEGFVVDEIGSFSGYAVRFADGRAPGAAGPPSASLFFFHDDVSRETAEAMAEGIARGRTGTVAVEGPRVEWALSSLGFESQTQEGWVAVGALDGRFFVWTVQVPRGRRADFEVKVDAVLSSWRWTGDRSFREPLRPGPR